MRIRYGEEAVLHQGEPYVWIGFGFSTERVGDRNISIALFLHSRTARGYAMRILKQMGLQSIPDTGDLAEDAAQIVKAIEAPPSRPPSAWCGCWNKGASGGSSSSACPSGRGENAAAGRSHQVVTEKRLPSYSLVVSVR